MKKVISFLLTVILIFTGMITLCSCKKEPISEWSKIRVASANLYSDNGYIDYANTVYFDTVTYPDLAEEGLFWTKWDDEKKEIVEVAADSAEGAALIDPSKPTLINIHGMLNDGYCSQERYIADSNIAFPEDYNLKLDYIPMNYVWILKGWNVGNFHYNRFASDNGNPPLIESKIWATDGKKGVRYQKEDQSYVNGATDYCLAEHFAAEYIRAMNLLPEAMGNQEIRVASHSMGGELTTAGLFLLTELADAGQLKHTKLPDRFANLDGYFGAMTGSIYMGPKDITIKWSGKGLVENNTPNTIIDCVKDIAANGIIIEYYSYPESALNQVLSYPLKKILLENSVYVEMNPYYKNTGYSMTMHGHNGVRTYYLLSLYNEPPKDVTDKTAEKTAASASTPTEVLKTLKGTRFILYTGSSTLIASDDTYIREALPEN